MGRVITSPGWKLRVGVDHPDIVVANTKATWFGGSNDPMDSGETASGYPTKGHPNLMGCSLPMRYEGRHKATRVALGGSPMPRMPFGIYSNGRPNKAGAWVRVTNNDTGNTIVVPVIDLGPARWTGKGIDLTIAAFKALGGSLRQGVMDVSYRVLGGAKYVSRDQPTEEVAPEPKKQDVRPSALPTVKSGPSVKLRPVKPTVVRPTYRKPSPLTRKPGFFSRVLKTIRTVGKRLDDFSRGRK